MGKNGYVAVSGPAIGVSGRMLAEPFYDAAVWSWAPPLRNTGRTVRRRLPADLRGSGWEDVPVYHQFPRAVSKAVRRGYDPRNGAAR